MKRLALSLTAFAILISTGFLFAGEKKTVKMKIEGMTCSLCVKRVEKYLSPLCGKLDVDPDKGEGVCVYEAPVTSKQVLEAANKSGFKTTEIH